MSKECISYVKFLEALLSSPLLIQPSTPNTLSTFSNPITVWVVINELYQPKIIQGYIYEILPNTQIYFREISKPDSYAKNIANVLTNKQVLLMLQVYNLFFLFPPIRINLYTSQPIRGQVSDSTAISRYLKLQLCG